MVHFGICARVHIYTNSVLPFFLTIFFLIWLALFLWIGCLIHLSLSVCVFCFFLCSITHCWTNGLKLWAFCCGDLNVSQFWDFICRDFHTQMMFVVVFFFTSYLVSPCICIWRANLVGCAANVHQIRHRLRNLMTMFHPHYKNNHFFFLSMSLFVSNTVRTNSFIHIKVMQQKLRRINVYYLSGMNCSMKLPKRITKPECEIINTQKNDNFIAFWHVHHKNVLHMKITGEYDGCFFSCLLHFILSTVCSAQISHHDQKAYKS